MKFVYSTGNILNHKDYQTIHRDVLRDKRNQRIRSSIWGDLSFIYSLLPQALLQRIVRIELVLLI